MTDTAIRERAAPVPTIEYRRLGAQERLPRDVLCAVAFGGSGSAAADPRAVRVALEPLRGRDITELWHAPSPIRIGEQGVVRYVADRDYLAAAIELDERAFDTITDAAYTAYSALSQFHARGEYRHVLRVWNYFDDINAGSGDAERYKQFCVGRAAALRNESVTSSPAATAIGRRDGSRILQIYWLAGRYPGRPLENPRQVSAYRYPRQHGPVSPTFSRAMLVADRLLMISGTASIVGHASHHPGNLAAQVNETLNNLEAVLQRAAAASTLVEPRFGPRSLLKVYLRPGQPAEVVEGILERRLAANVPYMILAADVCRADLLVEIDCVHG